MYVYIYIYIYILFIHVFMYLFISITYTYANRYSLYIYIYIYIYMTVHIDTPQISKKPSIVSTRGLFSQGEAKGPKPVEVTGVRGFGIWAVRAFGSYGLGLRG